ncbi:MAG: alpha/beta fold hydrolase [Myxococcota bacterium]
MTNNHPFPMYDFPERPQEKTLFFPSREEHAQQLEGRLHQQPGPGACVVCHPHPQHGGTMDNKVVDTAVRSAAAQGYSTLRFNYRGVGKSEGIYGEGRLEVFDLLGAIDVLLQETQATSLVLCGFSFGTAVISDTVAQTPTLLPQHSHSQLHAVVLIAPPLSMRALPTFAVPPQGLHMILGAQDEFCTTERFQKHAQAFSGDVQHYVLPESGHFFHGFLPELSSFLQHAVNHTPKR